MLDRVRNLFGRKPADRRVHFRKVDAASPGNRRGHGIGTFQSFSGEVAGSLELTRSRSRYLAVNDPWASNALANWVGHLVGAEIRPVPKGLPEAERRTVMALFDAWAERACASGLGNLGSVQAQAVTHMVRDGDSIVVMIDEDDGLRLQVVPPERLDTARTVARSDGGVIVQGVEVDARGRRVAYWLFPDAPDSQFATFTESRRFDAADVLHLFKPMGGDQIRGLSWFAPIVMTASELDKLRDALLTGYATSAMFMGFLTDMNGAASEPFNFDADGTVSLEPGTIQTIPPGYDIKMTSPEQAKDAPAFVRLNLQAYAAGLGLPDFLVSGDLSNANYSSLRAGLLPFRQRVEQIQYHNIVPMLLAPIWRRWLATEIASGRLDVPPDLGCEWIMPRQLQVDPAKDVAAVREMLALGLMSRSQAVAELGWDAATLDAEIAADRAREAALGLSFGGSNVPT